MATGIVFRPVARDAHGDPVDADGNVVRLSGSDSAFKVGTIEGLIIGGASGISKTGVYPAPSLRGDVVFTSDMIGFPSNSEIQLKAGDVVQVDGQRFKVSGPILFGGKHSLTGRRLRYSWISATSN